MQLWDAKDLVVEMGRRLWQRGYVAANDGNLTIRLDEDRLLATPTGVSKGFMRPEMLIITDMEGRVIDGDRQPSSELKMHLEVYRLRSDVQAVVHAHPPVSTAMSVAGVALDKCVLPESVLTMGAIPTAPYATPSTDEIPAGLRPFIPNCDAVLLANHGAVTWAADIETAYFRMETLEHTANITFQAMLLGQVNVLGQGDVEKLKQVRERMGIPGRALPCEAAGTCSIDGGDTERLVETVAQTVLRELSKK